MPTTQLGTFFIVGLVAFAVQCVYVTKRIFHYDKKRTVGFLGEVLLLIFICMLVLMPGAVYGYRPHGVVSNDFMEEVLLIFGFAATIPFVFSSVETKAQRMTAVFCLYLTQPALASTLDVSYHIFWVIGIMLLLLRSYFIIYTENARQKEELSTASIQEGLDNLPAGILFCGTDGYIYLENKKMLALMLRFFGAELKNGNHLWEKLTSGELLVAQTQSIDEDVLVRTEHDAWRFAKRKFRVKNTEFIEIIAVDATESYVVLRKLELESDELAKETVETAKLAETMETVQKEREYLRIRSEVHDILSQQLTAMQRLSQGENVEKYNEFLTHSREAIAQIKEQRHKNAQLFFEEITLYYKNIGLEINLSPELPSESSVAFLMLTALREACTNAVRHAGATLVTVTVEEGPEGYRIAIKNNGERAKKGLVEGGGLFGIRTRVEDAGGTLKVEVIPEFSLIITISSEGIVANSNLTEKSPKKVEPTSPR